MKILIVHPRFPGQFGLLEEALAARDDCEVVGLGEGARGGAAHGHYVDLRPHLGPHHGLTAPLLGLQDQVRRGDGVRRVIRRLGEEGFSPDIVVNHPGWGDGLFLRDACPRAKILSYLEYHYRTGDDDGDFDAEFPMAEIERRYVRLRNIANLLAFESSDIRVTPTRWQHARFPEAMRTGIAVQHEGIDTVAAAPPTKASLALPDGRILDRSMEVVTFVARSLEPMRGFHVFMRALPDLLRRRPRAHVVIVGADDTTYARPPEDAETWLEAMLRETGRELDPARVSFLGHVERSIYLDVLRVSSVHVYLTYPFILSWSLLEAMASGCAVVASRTGPVGEVIEDGRDGCLVDFFDKAALIDRVIALLDDPGERRRLGRHARAKIVDQFDFKRRSWPAYRALLGLC